jgi:hypothetical protein
MKLYPKYRRITACQEGLDRVIAKGKKRTPVTPARAEVVGDLGELFGGKKL